MECFFKFLPRDLIDLANSGGRVFDGIEQVFSLRCEELVALRRFLVLFERHHVDRAHSVEAGAHLAVRLIFGGKFIPGNQRNRLVGRSLGHQDRTFHAQLVQASVGQVLQVGLQFGGCGR